MQTRLTTTDLSSALGLKPESIRSHYYRNGSYYGLQPLKAPNGRLLWPADSIERLVGKEGEQ